MFIFLDESGDLGFGVKEGAGSKTFTIAVLVCEDEKAARGVRHAVKRTLKNKINAKRRRMFQQELKGSSTSLASKLYFYERMPESGWCVCSISVNKERVYPQLRTAAGKKKLYNFLTKELLSSLSSLVPSPAHVHLVVDQCKDGEDRKDFNAYIKANLETSFPFQTSIHISHENSQNNACLQAADLFCWGIQRMEDRGDGEWAEIYRSHLKAHIRYLYPKK